MNGWTSPERRNDRYDIEEKFNALRFELCEAAEVKFQARGRNRFPFSRLFSVFETFPGPKSVLINHTQDQRFEMETGKLYFLPSGVDFEFDFQKTTHFLSFHFHLERYGAEVFAGERLFQCLADEDGTIPQLLALLRNEHPSLRQYWKLRQLLSAEISRLLPESAVPETDEDAARYARYAGLLRFLREEAHGALSIEDLAVVAGIPQQRLSREFPHDFGMTLKQYLARSVAARAEMLLRNPKIKVREVARKLRFRDEYYFSRFFRHETGASPSDYRKLIAHP